MYRYNKFHIKIRKLNTIISETIVVIISLMFACPRVSLCMACICESEELRRFTCKYACKRCSYFQVNKSTKMYPQSCNISLRITTFNK